MKFSVVIMGVCALAVVAVTLVFMPASELMPAQVTAGPISPGLSPVRSQDAMDFYKSVADKIWGTTDLLQVDKTSMPDGSPGDLRAYEKYALFFALALTLAAVAINAIGRFDSEEKTVVPVKK